MEPSTLSNETPAFEESKTILAFTYLELMATCLYYRVALDPSSKLQGRRKYPLKDETPESLEALVKNVEARYKESIALSTSNRSELGKIKVMLLDLSYRTQLRRNLPKLFDAVPDMPEVDVLRRIYELSVEELGTRPSEILRMIEDLERFALSPLLSKLTGQAQLFVEILAPANKKAGQLKTSLDAIKADVEFIAPYRDGDLHYCANGHPHIIRDHSRTLQQSVCHLCGEAIAAAGPQLASAREIGGTPAACASRSIHPAYDPHTTELPVQETSLLGRS